MKNQDNIPPVFYCKTWIDEQGNLKKYKSEECKNQCSSCSDVIIEYHLNKKNKLKCN